MCIFIEHHICLQKGTQKYRKMDRHLISVQAQLIDEAVCWMYSTPTLIGCHDDVKLFLQTIGLCCCTVM